MLQLVLGRAGSGKTRWVMDQLAGNDDARPAVLIVPEQVSFESERALLQLPAHRAVEVLSFSRLCDRVFKLYGGVAGARVSPGEKLLLMARAVRQVEDRLTLYRRHAKSTDFYRHLLAIAGEFKYSGVQANQLAEAADRLPDGPLQRKITELSTILAAYAALLNASFTDPDDDLLRLQAVLARHPYFAGKTVYIDAFKDFTAPQKGVLRHIIATADRVCVTLCADRLQPEHALEVFANTKKLAGELTRMATSQGVPVAAPVVLAENRRAQDPALAAVEAVLAGQPAEWNEPTEAFTVCACPTVYDEADWVAATVRRLTREEGLRHRDIMVIARDARAYEGILDAAFDRCGIPYFSDRRRPVSQLPLFACALKALAMGVGSLDTAALLSLLKTGVVGFTPLEISTLENYVFVWNVTGAAIGRPFTQNPAGTDAGPADPEALAAVEALRRRIVQPLVRLQEACRTAETARDYCAALFAFLSETGAPDHLQAMAEQLAAAGDTFEAEDLLRSWPTFCTLLDQTVTALGETRLAGADFAQLLGVMIDAAELGKIPQGLDQVTVGSADRTRPAQPAVVFLLGANQGVFPATPSSGGLLTDRDRLQLNEVDIPIADRCAFDTVEEAFLFYSAACAARCRLFCSYVTGAGESKAEPCLPLARLQRRLPHHKKIDLAAARREQPLALVQAEAPAFDLLARRFGEDSPLADGLTRWFAANRPQRLAVLQRVAAPPAPTLSPDHAAALFGRHMRLSPSGVEVFHHCRFQYFCRYGLAVKVRRPAALDGLSQGKLSHYVLEQMVKRHGSRGLCGLSEDAMKQAVEELTAAYIDQNLGGLQDKPATFRYQLGRVKRLLLDLLIHMAKELGESRFETVACELPVGQGADGLPALRLDLPDGGTLSVTGVVDRLDVFEADGATYCRVVDYKSGGKAFALDDLYYGIGLQMLIYLRAVEQNGGRFGPHRLPAGVLYMPVKRPVVPETDDNALEQKLAASLKMTGVVLNNAAVTEAMDPTNAGVFLPFKMKKDGTPDVRSQLADLAFFGRVGRRIDQLLSQMGDDLQHGRITCDPLDSTHAAACDRCDFKAVCPAGGQGAHRAVPVLTPAQRKALLKGDDYRELVPDAPTSPGHS